MEKLSGWAAEQNDPLLKFSAKPEFEEIVRRGDRQPDARQPRVDLPRRHRAGRRPGGARPLPQVHRPLRRS